MIIEGLKALRIIGYREKGFPLKGSPHLQNFPQLNAFHAKPGFISLIGHRGARGLMPENTIEA